MAVEEDEGEEDKGVQEKVEEKKSHKYSMVALWKKAVG